MSCILRTGHHSHFLHFLITCTFAIHKSGESKHLNSQYILAKAAEKPEKPKLLERQKVNEPKKVKSEVKKPTKSAPPKTVTEKVEKAAEKIEKSVNKENVENGLDDGKFQFIHFLCE